VTDWTYNDLPVTDEMIEGKKAFVYIIENLTTGKKYVGKKRLQIKRSKKPLKGKKRRRITYAESDWRTYWGSNDLLNEHVKELGEEKFTRKILRLCTNLAESSYWEAHYQFQYGVLLSDDWYNSWISVRVTENHLRSLRGSEE
jgi:hypothetical protein